MSPPHYWAKAVEALAAKDARLQKIMIAIPHTESLVSRADPFITLMRSIVGQQISVKAADAVWTRLAQQLPNLSPEAVLSSSHEVLRACGLSARKLEYIQDLAAHFSQGKIDVDHWVMCDDKEIIAKLTAVRGIGVWTAEMFLIFNLLRPDVFPLDDIGLQRAVAQHYYEGARPDRKTLIELGETWRPWRSVATWYLWRSLDPIPVEY